jgi:LPXTG-motif cell wall-anchored protein
VQVSNTGTRPVKGAVLVLESLDPKMTEGETFSNCRYGLITSCTFEDELATGTTYELSKSMRVKVPADAAAGSRASVIGGWYTPSDFKELIDLGFDLDDEILGKKGTGGPVALRAVPARKGLRAAGQIDTNPDNNIMVSEFVVGGDRRPDMAAIGATISGAAGDKVRAKVGYVNNGPGALYLGMFDNVDPLTHVFVPAGLRTTKVDEACMPFGYPADTDPDDMYEDVTGASEYLCFNKVDKTEAAASNLFDFTFEVRENASAKAGQVRINEVIGCECGEEPEGDDIEDHNIDRNAANDTAKIAVELSSGGTGGGLPVTGANAGLAGAAGGVLLLAGVLGLMLVRRRRVRFTA